LSADFEVLKRKDLTVSAIFLFNE